MFMSYQQIQSTKKVFCFFIASLSPDLYVLNDLPILCVTQKSRAQTKEPTRKARTVELFVVVDHTEVRAAVFLLSDSLQMSSISHNDALFPLEERTIFEVQFIHLNCPFFSVQKVWQYQDRGGPGA